MDIISYGVASKASKLEKNTRTNVLGTGVEGTHPHARGRIDILENSIQSVNKQADKLIVNDAVNIMKAHAKLNSVAKTMKYKMHNMIFDDLLDLSGIDTTKSNGYTHDALNGWLTSGTIETKTEIADAIPTKIILVIEESSGVGNYSISRDDGVSWEAITPNKLFYFNDKFSPQGNKIRLKAQLPNGVKLLNYALTWA